MKSTDVLVRHLRDEIRQLEKDLGRLKLKDVERQELQLTIKKKREIVISKVRQLAEEKL